MTFHWKSGRFSTAAVLIFLITTSAQLASAQTGRTKAQPGAANDKAAGATENEEARLKQFLDKDGGYKDKHGGYYNPKAGTYTDEDGGIVDNWGGYTYANGSYKSKLGDFWNAPKKTFELANGETLKSDDITSAQAITLLRETVEEQGGYDKDLTRRSMMAQIKAEHPLTPSKAGKRP
jgi:hypothetical protein